jgi:hypothetical protein
MNMLSPTPDSFLPLTPRQDRIEARIVALLRTGATRSMLRDAIHELADLLRMQGVPPERAIARLKGLVEQALPAIAAREPLSVGDTGADRMGMVVRWCTARYFRDD